MRIWADNLGCRRGGRRVYRGVTLAVEPGRAMQLRGPNGAGKSTLLRQFAGLLPVIEGDAGIGAVSLARDPADARAHVAYAGHLDAIKPALGVRANLSFWAGFLGVADDARIDAALARLGLEAVSDAPAAYCSAGQKRRLGLARLLVADRPVWLLDEPTVSLDAAATGVVAAMVREHCAAGGSALIATHIDLGLPGMESFEMPGRDAVMSPGTAAADKDDPFLTGTGS